MPATLTPLDPPRGRRPIHRTPKPLQGLLPAVVLSLLLSAPSVVSAQTADGVVSQVSGHVLLVEPGPGAGGAAFAARPLQVLAAGTFLELGRGAAATVLCAEDVLVRLSGPTSWRLGPATCSQGSPLPDGTFLRLVPGAGRVRALAGTLFEESPSRGDDGFGTEPVLLSPRSPQRSTVTIFEARPEIAWAEVRGTLEYEVVVVRSDGERTTTVAGRTANCQPDLRTRPLRSCRLEWQGAALSPGEKVTLQVRARVGDPSRPLRESDAALLQRMGTEAHSAVARELEALSDSTEPSFELLRAFLFSHHGLYNEAAAHLAAAFEEQPQATLAVQLADLYLGLGLHQSALHLYQRAESLLPPRRGESATRATVHMGYGRLYLRGKDPRPPLAVESFRRAARLFQEAGLDREAQQAETEAARAGRGLP